MQMEFSALLLCWAPLFLQGQPRLSHQSSQGGSADTTLLTLANIVINFFGFQSHNMAVHYVFVVVAVWEFCLFYLVFNQSTHKLSHFSIFFIVSSHTIGVTLALSGAA